MSHQKLYVRTVQPVKMPCRDAVADVNATIAEIVAKPEFCAHHLRIGTCRRAPQRRSAGSPKACPVQAGQPGGVRVPRERLPKIYVSSTGALYGLTMFPEEYVVARGGGSVPCSDSRLVPPSSADACRDQDVPSRPKSFRMLPRSDTTRRPTLAVETYPSAAGSHAPTPMCGRHRRPHQDRCRLLRAHRAASGPESLEARA